MDFPEFDDLLAIRTPSVMFYVLKSDDGLFLIDTGFLGGLSALRAGLKRRGWNHIPIRGIVLTHGHIDHVINAGTLAEETGAWIAAPRKDADHCEGKHVYHGLSKVCGAMEAACRKIFGYKTFRVDRWLDDRNELPIWGGLQVVHLPGHTDGHSGLYCAERGLLFSGDLFASFGKCGVLPPGIFNSHPEMIPESIEKALSLELDGVIPNHGLVATPSEHLKQLRRLHEKLGRG